MDWKTFIGERAATIGQVVTFGPPAAADDIERLVSEFSIQLPAEYRELLTQANGVFDEYRCAVVDSVAEVIQMNRASRNLAHCMPLDHLFFVSSAYGNGDLLGYGIRQDRRCSALFRWDHEDDSRTLEAPDLKTWIQSIYSSKGDA